IAVVVPVYNAALTVEQALNSVRQQSLGEWRAVVVDDGSDDDSGALISRLAAADGRIELLAGEANGGVSAARNRALATIEEEWTLFLDADDWLAPDALERLVARASRGDCDAIHGGTARVYADGTLEAVERLPDGPDQFPVFARAPALPIHSCLVRTQTVRDAGGFDETLINGEDWDLWQRASGRGCRWGAIDARVAFYRMRPGSASHTGSRLLIDGLRVIDRGHDCGRWGARAPSERYRLLARTYLACSASGIAIGRDEPEPEPQRMLGLLGEEISPAVGADVAARVVFESIAIGAAIPARAWPEYADRFRERALHWLTALGSRSGVAGFARDAEASLDRLNLLQSAGGARLGRRLLQEVELGRPCRSTRAAPGVDRIVVRVRDRDQIVADTDVVPGDRQLPALVIADALAAEHGWLLLLLFLRERLGDELAFHREGSVVTVRRRSQALYSGPLDETRPPLHAAMEHVGWTLLLQEIWAEPDWPLARFYTAGPASDDPAVPAEPEDLIEVIDGLPVIELAARPARMRAERPVRVGIRLAGAPLGLVNVKPVDGWVRSDAIRVAVLEQVGFELCRAVVRQLVLRGWSDGASLRERLREPNPVGSPGRPPAGANVISGWSGSASEAAEGLGGLTLLGCRRPTKTHTPQRAALLPASVREVVTSAARRSGEPVVEIDGAAGPLLRAPFLIATDDDRPPDLAPRNRPWKGLRRSSPTPAPSGSDALTILLFDDVAALLDGVSRLDGAGIAFVSLRKWVVAAAARQPIGRAVTVVCRLRPEPLGRRSIHRLIACRDAATVLVSDDGRRGGACAPKTVRRLTRAGLEIGCLAGADLADTGPAELAARLFAQRDDVRAVTGQTPAVIGFLDGRPDHGAAQIASAAGFEIGLVRGAWPASFADPPIRLPTITAPRRDEILRLVVSPT
ncbi:MAG: glycosyltransferase, partial [Solirubrobacteraceae bacterium]